MSTATSLQKRMNNLHGLFERMKPELQKALPKHLGADRMVRVFFTELRKNPGLADCTPESLAGSLIQASQLGLEPGLMGQCYLVPFNNRKSGRTVKEVQFIIGYKGLIDLARRSGDLVTLYANPVYENDEFEYSYGVEGTLNHIPKLQGRGSVIAYYAYAKLKDGGYHYEVMSREDVMAHARKHSKTYSKKDKAFSGPWRDDFDAMACKTAVRQMMKYLPLSIELSEQIQTDEGVNRFENGKLDMEIIDTGSLDPAMEIDGESRNEPTKITDSIRQNTGNSNAPDAKQRLLDQVIEAGKEIHGKNWYKESKLYCSNLSDDTAANLLELTEEQLGMLLKILQSKAEEDG